MSSARLEIEERDGVRRATLVRGRGNALDPRTLTELEGLFEPNAKAPPVLLGAHGRSFCTGLDLRLAASLDREGMRELMEAFHGALRACFAYPAPVVAALAGHALAGGALLALACDRRVMACGEARFGIHGVKMGIAYPDVAVEILRHQLPRPLLEDLLYRGRLYDDGEAWRLGLVDALEEPGDVETRALREIGTPDAAGVPSRRRTKLALRRRALERLTNSDEEGRERWLDRWFDPRTQGKIRRALRTLGGTT